MLAIPIGTVMSRLIAARKFLQKRLYDHAQGHACGGCGRLRRDSRMDCDDCVESCSPSSTPSDGEGERRRPLASCGCDDWRRHFVFEARFPRAASRLLHVDVAPRGAPTARDAEVKRAAPTAADDGVTASDVRTAKC